MLRANDPCRRRTILSGTMATGAVLTMAGCGSSTDSGTADDGEDGGDGVVDDELTFAGNISNPNDLQWNKYFVQGSGAGNWFMYDPLAVAGNYPRGVDASDFPDWHEMIAREFSVEGTTLMLSLHDGYTWHDGDPVLAEDILLQYRLEKAIGFRTGNVWETASAPDDHTVEFSLTSPNADIALPQLLPVRIRTKRGTAYTSLLESIESATTDEERQKAQGEVTSTRISNAVGTGLWKLEGTSSSRLSLALHEGHPMADTLNFDSLAVEAVPNNQKRWLGLQEGNVDGLTHATAPETIEEGFPDHVERIPYVSPAGDCLLFNFDRIFGDRRVRQAITFVVNRWQNSHNAKDFVDTIRYPCGLPNHVMEEWLGSDLEGFYQYGYESSRTDPAAALLEDAGFSREDGEWYTPEGERFRFQILSGSGGTWKLNNRSAASSLSEFGIDAVSKITEGAAFGERVQQGDYDMAMDAWGAFGGGWHPYNFFSQEFSERNTAKQHIDPTAASVPYPVGDPEGDVETVDVLAKIDALAQAETEAEATDLVRELAWIYNQFLPRIPLMNGVSRRFLTRDDWEFPAVDTQWMVDNPVSNLMRLGQFRAKTA